MREIVYTAGAYVNQEPYTHRLVGRILAEAQHRQYSIRFKVPDSNEALAKTLLMKIVRDEGKNGEKFNIESPFVGLSPPSPGSILLYAGSFDYCRMLMLAPQSVKHYKKIYWVQGLESEESFLKHNNRIRKEVLSKLESYAMKDAKVIICPSDSMIETLLIRYPFLRHNYFITIPNLADCSPCPQRDFTLWGFDKSPSLTLGYMGGLSDWQCFEETCRIVVEVQKLMPDTWFLVLTRELHQAELILEDIGVKQYIIRCCATEDAQNYAASFDLGFMLRRTNIINYVACPMKWLEYWQCGVPLITTRAVRIVEEADSSCLNCIVDIDNAKRAAQDIVKYASHSKIESLHISSAIISMVNKYWTWQLGYKAINDVFQKLEGSTVSRQSLWKDRLFDNCS
jgi:hypothetical protein